MTTLLAVVLAGGRSARMGEDKALLSVGPETLLQRTCRVAAACCEGVYVITPFPERYRHQLFGNIILIQESPLPGQQEAFHGPLVGLLQAINFLDFTQHSYQSQNLWILALACDLPNLSDKVLAHWQHLVSTQPLGIMACLPQRQGHWEPLCGFYRGACQDSMEHYVSQGGRSFQGWLRHESVTKLPLAEPAMLLNLNTPEDWQNWQAQGR